MRDQLHNEIDQLEELRIRAKQTSDQVVTDRLGEIIDQTEDIGKMMKGLAEAIEEEMASLTTEAFGVGVGFARARRDSVEDNSDENPS